MLPVTLPESDWEIIYTFLKNYPGLYLGNEIKARRFIEGVLWLSRSGAPWRFLPADYGKWNSIYQRFSRWSERGIWQALFDHLAADPDCEWLLLDSTIVRAHPCAAGALKKNGGQAAHALGRSRGGFSTKIHLITDALGNPLDFVLTGGQTHDVTQAQTLLTGQRGEYVIADTAYDASALIDWIEAHGAIPVIPARRNRKTPRWHDRDLYKERHAIEACINKLKHYRHIFSRFDK